MSASWIIYLRCSQLNAMKSNKQQTTGREGGNCIERTERTWWRNGDTERWDADEEPNSGQEARKKHQISIYYLLSTIHQKHNQERKNFTPDRKSLEVGREIRKRLNLLLMKPYLSYFWVWQHSAVLQLQAHSNNHPSIRFNMFALKKKWLISFTLSRF